ncbi:MAG: hypothetical protein MUO73_00415, partial [Thermoplasmata archaeon]|nr:hypothetical protein [Thermoplasmata archaeon]
MKKVKGKILYITIVALVILHSFPVVAETSNPSTIIFISEKNQSKTQSMDQLSLLNNLDIKCHGIYPVDIPLSILGWPVYYIRTEI